MNVVRVHDSDGSDWDMFLVLPADMEVAAVDAAINAVKEDKPDTFDSDDLLAALPGVEILKYSDAEERW